MAVDAFEKTLQKTYEWLRDLMKLLEWKDEQRAYMVLKGTLHALRDRLPPDLSAKISSQLPMLIRGFYYEGWIPASTPIKVKTAEEFLDLVSTHFNNMAFMQEDVERIVRAVFQLITHHISAGEIMRIKQNLPIGIAAFWPSSEYSEDQEAMRKRTKQATRHPHL